VYARFNLSALHAQVLGRTEHNHSNKPKKETKVKTIPPNQHSKRKHSHFAASSSHRWLNCAASVELSKKAPPEKESPYAAEGTRAHECMEFIVKRFGSKDHGKAEALKKWPADMVEHAVKSAETVFKLKPSPTAFLLVETRVVLKHISPGLFGTLDYAWVDEWGELTIIDFKYGAGVPVLPYDEDTKEPNSQLMYYASGIAAKYNYEFSHIKLAIIQPRVWREDEDPLTEAKVNLKALRDFEKKVKAAVVAASKPNLQPTPAPADSGENWCRWCPAASFCPAISKMKMAEVGIEFSVEEGVEEAKLPDVRALTPETIGKVLDACDLLDVWIGKVRAAAFQMAASGEKVPGRKLVEKRSVRYWLPDAEEKAEERFGHKAFTKPELLSPAQLEKAIGKDGKSFTEEYTDNKSSGYSLVSLKDKRPEAVVSSIDFSVEAEENDF